MPITLPLPPFEMRQLVGPTDPLLFDNPSGHLVFPDVPVEAYESVFDFGCGCGRIARMLIQQMPRPHRYVGIDLHLGMVRWCQANLEPYAEGFKFLHHNVRNISSRGSCFSKLKQHLYDILNPGDHKPTKLPFPASDGSFKLVIAWSVFTHSLEEQTVYYLKEVSHILYRDGIFLSTWFLFDKLYFPMMQEFQNALFDQ